MLPEPVKRLGPLAVSVTAAMECARPNPIQVQEAQERKPLWGESRWHPSSLKFPSCHLFTLHLFLVRPVS